MQIAAIRPRYNKHKVQTKASLADNKYNANSGYPRGKTCFFEKCIEPGQSQ